MADEQSEAGEFVEYDREIAIAFAKLHERRAEESLRMMIQLSMWLTASLLAINGAGALAVLNSSIAAPSPKISAAIFVGGIMAAMLSAWFNQVASLHDVPKQEDLMVRWNRAAIDGGITRQQLAAIEEKQKSTFWADNSGPLCGWVSALIFIAGCASLAWPTIPASSGRKVAPAKPHSAAMQHQASARADR